MTTATATPVDPASWVWHHDAWENKLTELGTPRDRAAWYRARLDVVDPLTAEKLARADGLAARVATIPVDDALLGGHELVVSTSSGKTDKKLAGELMARREQLDRLDVEDRGIPSAEHRVLAMARVLGGAALLPVTNDFDPLDTPLRAGKVAVLGLRVLDLRELTPMEWSRVDGRVVRWQVSRRTEAGLDQPVVVVHASRLIRTHGVAVVVTPESGPTLPGWPADSCYTQVYERLSQYSGTIGGTAAILSDFAQLVYRIKGLSATRGRDDMHQLLRKRLQLIDVARSMVRGIALDADSESAERVTTSLAGYSEAADRIALALSAATGIPATRLLGRAPDGMNATGASDTANYHALVQTYRAERVEPLHAEIYRWILRDMGRDPAQYRLQITYAPLSEPSDLEVAQTRKTVAERDKTDIESGVVTAEEVARSRYGGDRYSIETTITPVEEVDVEAEEQAKAGDRLATLEAVAKLVAQVNTGTVTWGQGLEMLTQLLGLEHAVATALLGPEREVAPSPAPPPDDSRAAGASDQPDDNQFETDDDETAR